MKGVARTRVGVLLSCLSLVLTGACGPRESADLLLHNGKVVTVDDSFSIESAIVVREGKIVAVGGNDLLRSYRAAQVIDLKGRTVLPGFNDTHIHIRGRPARFIDLTRVESIEEIQRKVRQMVERLGEGEWVTGYGWSEDTLAEGRRPLRADLDRAAPRNPVILTRAGGHSSVVNSMALRLAGVTTDTPDPEGGVIERDERGELNGIIRERAGIVGHLVPEATPAELRDSFVQNLRELLSLGVTSIIHAGSTIEEYQEWETVYRAHGEELPRAAVQIRWAGREEMEALGKKTGDGDTRLRVGAVKVLVDGGFTGPAAYTSQPYKGQPNYYGKLNVKEDELRKIVRDAHEMGWQLGFHAIGDAAIQLTVDTFVEVLHASPRDDHRHYLNHFTVPPPEETLEKMAENDILIAQQPNFTYTLEGRYTANLDGDRLQHNNPLKTPMSHGIFMALGSDILPIGPMVGLYAAVTRKGMSGAVYGEDEGLTIEEAITGYTRNGAYLTWEEAIKGTLEPGKLADMVVLGEDLLSIDAERIRDVQVDLTMVGGKILYRRRRTES